MKKLLVSWLLTILPVAALVSGCISNTGLPQQTAISELLPYQTRTPFFLPTATLAPTLTIAPTPTPVIYKIRLNDTLSSLAQRFGVSLDLLLAANPGIIPEALVVGDSITIPALNAVGGAGLKPAPYSGIQTNVEFLSTPVPLEIGTALCQQSGSGTYCIIPVQNPDTQAVENIILECTLIDENGNSLTPLGQQAILPLNLLPPNQSLPAGIFFGNQVGKNVQARLISSVRLEPGDKRYLKAAVQNLLVTINWDGLSANIQGQIFLPELEKPASNIWVVAVAFNNSEQITGFRRREFNSPVQPGGIQEFNFPVYSFGASIQRVEVIVEAHP